MTCSSPAVVWRRAPLGISGHASTRRTTKPMGLGTSLFLITAGAVLKFAVHTTNTHGFDINTVGTILMIVGIVGFLASLIFWNSWGGWGGARRRTTTYVDDAPY